VSLEENRAVVRRFVDELNNEGRMEVADEIFAPECYAHALDYRPVPMNPRVNGPAHIKPLTRLWRYGFPDWKMTIDQLIAEDDKVVLVYTAGGTHMGRIGDMGPTGKEIRFSGIRVFRIVEGRIVEYWNLWDWKGLWQQLGMIPQLPNLRSQIDQQKGPGT
jgi:predicted SnoaL-like aldol condensation-catalyzing enzyme